MRESGVHKSNYLNHLQPPLIIRRRFRMIGKDNTVIVAGMADDIVLKLSLVAAKSLHYHDTGLQLAIKPAVVAIESVHAAGHVHH